MNFIKLTGVKVILDLDENPEKGNNKPYIYQGDCHPLHHDNIHVLFVYCKISDEEENNHLCIIFLP